MIDNQTTFTMTATTLMQYGQGGAGHGTTAPGWEMGAGYFWLAAAPMHLAGPC